VISNNAGRFRRQLSAREILMFEAIAFSELQQFGYALTYPVEELRSRHEEMLRPKLQYRISEFALSLQAEVRHLLKDRNSINRLGKSLYMKYIRIARSISAQHA
jgi:hypothetical protein